MERQQYTVKKGDTLGKIARNFGVTVAELVEWNGIENPDLIRPGMVLWVSPPIEEPQPADYYTQAEIDTMLNQVSGRLDEAEARIQANQARLDEDDARLGSLDTRLNSLDAVTGNLAQSASALEADIAALEDDMTEQVSKILEQHIAPLAIQVTDLRMRVETLEGQVDPDPGPGPDPDPDPDYVLPTGSDVEYVTSYSELQSAMNSSPSGTKFILADGVYPVNRPTGLKDGMEFWAENKHGAIWDGGNTITHAISNASANGNADFITFAGLEVRNYANTITGQGPIDAYLKEGWRFMDLITHDNRQAGLGFGQGSLVLRVHAYDNGETGMTGNKCDGAVIDSVLLEGNGHRYTSNPMWSSGGLKTFRNPDTGSNRGFIIRNSVARNNIGGGFWTDFVRGVDITIEDCLAEGNHLNYFIEASSGTHVLRRIRSLRDGAGGFTVYVSGSEHVSVINSEVDGGIMFSEDGSEWPNRKCEVGLAEGNRIRISREMSNGYQVQSSRDYRTLCDPEKIVWRDNSYEMADESVRAFKWWGGPLTLAQWLAVGHS